MFKLHMLCMGLSTKSEKDKLQRFCDGEEAVYTVIRFDPAVNRALNFALTDGVIVQQGNGLFCLTESGKRFANYIKEDDSLMVSEKLFLKKVADKLTEEKINVLIARWGNNDAAN